MTDADGRSERSIVDLEKQLEELSERLAKLERVREAEDPRSATLDKEEAAADVDRLLTGTARIPLAEDVEALLWTYKLRRLGLLTAEEYHIQKKRQLGRVLDQSDNPPPTGNQTKNRSERENADTSATSPTAKPTT